MAKAPASEMGSSSMAKAPKDKYVASDGVCDGESFEAATAPWFGNPNAEITGLEIGEPTNQPGNPWGPDGSEVPVHDQPVSPPTKVAAKSSPSGMASGASKPGK